MWILFPLTTIVVQYQQSKLCLSQLQSSTELFLFSVFHLAADFLTCNETFKLTESLETHNAHHTPLISLEATVIFVI